MKKLYKLFVKYEDDPSTWVEVQEVNTGSITKPRGIIKYRYQPIAEDDDPIKRMFGR